MVYEKNSIQRRRSMKKIVLVLSVALLCLLPSLATADLISGPFTTSTPISSTLTDWNGSLSFPKFNSSLGILQSVTLYVSGSMSTVLTVTNSSPTGSSGTAKTELQYTIQDSGGNLNVPQIDLIGPSYAYNLGAGGTITSGTLTKSGNNTEVYTLAAILAEFTGPGTIILPASTFTQTLVANTGGNTAASQITNASLTGTVTYNYITPEPATLILFGLGTLLFRRKHA